MKANPKKPPKKTAAKRKRTADNSAQNWTADGITLKQERAIAAVLEGRTIEAAMKKARLARSTFYEWLKEDRFREELNARRKYLFQAALEDLKALLGDSVHELQRLILYQDPKIRLSAVRTSIDAALRANEQLDFLDRLENLEAEDRQFR